MRAVTHPYPGAFTLSPDASCISGTAGPWRRRLAAPDEPGQVTAALPGEGLLVATGNGDFLITQAQWEGSRNFWGRCWPPGSTWWGRDLIEFGKLM